MARFGIKTKVYPGERVDEVNCGGCGEPALASYGVLKSFHIYGVPMIPFSGKTALQCNACEQSVAMDELADADRSRVSPVIDLLKRLKGAWGLLLLALVLAIGAYTSMQNKKEYARMLANPQVGDVYIVRMDDMFPELEDAYTYGVVKVATVTDDGIEARLGGASYTRAKGVRKDVRRGKLEDAGFFVPGRFEYTIGELTALLESGAIYEVIRN